DSGAATAASSTSARTMARFIMISLLSSLTYLEGGLTRGVSRDVRAWWGSLVLPRLGSVVALQIRENGLCRGFRNRCAERADHLVHHRLPRGTRERGLHRDVRRAVTD